MNPQFNHVQYLQILYFIILRKDLQADASTISAEIKHVDNLFESEFCYNEIISNNDNIYIIHGYLAQKKKTV
jgi:hypothetical protein